MSESEDPPEKFNRIIRSEAETQNEPPAEEVTPSRGTPPIRRPAIDENGMPLPRRVDEIDVNATRVTPAAYERTPTPVTRRSVSAPPKMGQTRWTRAQPVRPKQTIEWPQAGGCLLRGMIISLFLVIALGLVMTAVGVFEYYSIASTLPSVSDLQQRASQFETTRILDRNGNVLYEIIDPQCRAAYLHPSE